MAFRELSLGRVSRRLGPWLDVAVPLGFGLALALLTPWRTAFVFGMDEGFELMKGLLVSQGHPLYGPFWNDQPPLHTEILAGLFRLFGPTAAVGRALSLVLAMSLVAALYGLARRGSNRLAGLVAVGLVVSGSEFLRLSVSVMLELPAFALGLVAMWLWVKGRESGRAGWLAGSGAVFGAALQVKLTAALLLPALAVDFLGARWCARRCGAKEPEEPVCRDGGSGRPGGVGVAGEAEGGLRRPLKWVGLLCWLAGVVGVFGLVMLLWYRPATWDVFLKSHFSAGTAVGANQRGALFQWTVLGEDVGLLMAGLGGLVLLIATRRREGVMPAVVLLTLVLVHQFHRPFWSYYRLHFAIPLAWLGGLGVVEGIRGLWRCFPPTSKRGWLGFGLRWLVWSVAVSSVLTWVPEKTWWELQRLRWEPAGVAQSHVAALRELAPRTRWIFTQDRLSAFWAGLPIPPELAVIPSKRRWTGQITPEQVRAGLERYRPELVFLPGTEVERFGLTSYLDEHYEASSSAGGLWVRKAP